MSGLDSISGRTKLYVGIDFGTTFTGVSWMRPECDDPGIHIVCDWPGGGGEKVPSILAKDTTEKDKKWGFLCQDLDESSKWRFLKLCLDRDPGQLKGISWAPNSPSDAYTLVEEYLGQIYLHISGSIPRETGSQKVTYQRWEECEIEFIFSVPGTWSPLVVHRFLDTTRRAGFGRQAHHKVVLGLTESVAAVVATNELAIPFTKGDTILSVDAGGGTTDLAFVTLQSMKPMIMEQVVSATAIGVGSVLIDMAFKHLVEARLETCSVPSDISKKYAAEMSQGRQFQIWKSTFGSTDNLHDDCQFDDDDISNALNNLGIQGASGWMSYNSRELEIMFDGQLQCIKDQVMSALDEFEQTEGQAKKQCVKHIVLSGGLGASEYVFQRLQEFLEWQKGRRSCLGGANLRISNNPQTAVVRGLLLDKQNDMLGSRKARASYGVVAQQVAFEKSNNRRWTPRNSRGKNVQGQIQWVIKKGATIQRNEKFSHKITKIFTKNDPEEWTETIVSSTYSLEYLPQNIKDAGVEVLCQVHVPLSSAPTEVKKCTRAS